MWGFNSWRGNEWQPKTGPKADDSYMFYHGDGGPVPTPRLEAFREGIEDLHLLMEAKTVLKRKPIRELAELVSEERLYALLKANDTEMTRIWRTDLLRKLAEEKNTKEL